MQYVPYKNTQKLKFCTLDVGNIDDFPIVCYFQECLKEFRCKKEELLLRLEGIYMKGTSATKRYMQEELLLRLEGICMKCTSVT